MNFNNWRNLFLLFNKVKKNNYKATLKCLLIDAPINDKILSS